MKKDSGYYLAMLDCCQGVSSKREDIGSTTRWNIARQLNYIICTWTLDRARTRSLHQSTKFVGKAITYGLAIIRFGCRPSNFGLHWFMVVQQCQLLSFILAVLEPQGKYFGIIGFQFAFFMKKKSSIPSLEIKNDYHLYTTLIELDLESQAVILVYTIVKVCMLCIEFMSLRSPDLPSFLVEILLSHGFAKECISQ